MTDEPSDAPPRPATEGEPSKADGASARGDAGADTSAGPGTDAGADTSAGPGTDAAAETDTAADAVAGADADGATSANRGDADQATPGPVVARRRLWIGGAVAVVLGAIGLVAWNGHRDSSLVDRDGSGVRGATHVPDRPALPPHPTGGVHLIGFVVDGAGLPVGGAEVSAEIEHGPRARFGNDSGSGSNAGGSGSNFGSDSLGGSGSAGGNAGGGTMSVAPPTGPDGRFTIEGLVAGRYRLRVTGKGLLAAEVRFVPVPSDAARIVVARQVSIDGTITDGGKPVGGAMVGLRGDAIGGSIEIKSEPSGAFHFENLPEGRYQLWAWQGSLAARAVRVARLGPGPFGPTELHLEAATIVVGRIIDRDEGTGIVAAVELRPVGDDQAPRYARSGTDGVFRIEGIPTGRWIADAFSPGYISPGGIELEAGKGVSELALVPGGSIEGRVVDGAGQPVAGASVRTLGSGASAPEISEQVDRDRLRRFSGQMAAPATPTASSLSADPQLIARGELGVMIGPIPPLPLPGAAIARTATVVDPSVPGGSMLGDPPPLESDPAHQSIWTTGSDGRYRIRGIPKQKTTVLAVATGYAEARSKAIVVEPGQHHTGIDLVLTAGTMIVGKVTDQHGRPVAGAELSAQPEIGAPAEGFSDADGEYKLGPVTGTVELHATAYGHGDAKRTLELAPSRGATAAERREDLVLVVADAMIAGTVDDSAGAPVAAAHLEIIGGGGEGRHAIVAADGTFSIDLLPAGHLRMRIEHPDYPPAEVDVIAGTDTAARARIRLPIGGAVEGALLDGSSGAALSSVTITGTGPAGAMAEASTDKNGRWKLGPLRPGHWKIEVKLAGYLPLTRELDVSASHAPGGTSVRDIRIDLARGALIGGTVRDATGHRVPGAHVIVRAGGVAAEGDTDAQGEFRVRDCPTGVVEVIATKRDASGGTTTTVRPGDEILGLSIDLR